jgi:hypothetical protein
MTPERPPDNPREKRKQNDRKLVLIILLSFVLFGGGLIAIIYDVGAFLTALPCLLGGSAVIAILFGLMGNLEKWLGDRY